MKQKTILVITDGIGSNSSDKFNAFANAKKPNYDYFFKNVPNSLLKTSGLAVGLPDGQMGNSEVGHMTIGSGRSLYQNLVKVDRAIEKNELKDNEALKNLLKICKNIHVIGLYSDGGVHSHLRHFDAIMQIAVDNGCKAYAHAITDGRDVSPTSGAEFIKHLDEKFGVSSICGRFYAMDRDKRWDRVRKAYEVIKNGANKISQTPLKYMQNSYANGVTDEFIEPASFGKFNGISKDDGIIFINFRNIYLFFIWQI